MSAPDDTTTGLAATPTPERSEDAPQSAARMVLLWIKIVALALAIVMVTNGLLVASFVVPSSSMENEVMTGDYVLVNKFIFGGTTPQTIPLLDIPLPYVRFPGLREPRKGDVIVFVYPGDRDQVSSPELQYYLKRCVATAGDTLELRNGRVYIDGAEQVMPRNAKYDDRPVDAGDWARTFPEGANYSRDNWGPMRIPRAGDVIPLNDSTLLLYRVFFAREGHEVTRNGDVVLVDGVPAATYTVQRDYCFGLGDNRNNSLDSRYWGFIPLEDVIGTPMVVYWSWDPTIPFTQPLEKIGSVVWSRIFNAVQ